MNITIEWIYKTKSGAKATFVSSPLSPFEALLLAEDIEKTGRVEQLILLDSHDSSWTMKDLKKYIKELETEPHNVTIYFDGSFQHDTNQAGLGIVVFYEQNNKSYRLRKNTYFNFIETNNEAEYAALSFGVNTCIELGVHHQEITIKSDSQVVVKQMSGDWPAYEQNLAKWADRIDETLQRYGLQAHFEHISRNLNKEADQLATQALNGIEICATAEQ